MALHDVLEVTSCTDAGLVRSFNEDSLAASAELGLMVLADGMGGYKAGDVASQLAIGVLVQEIKQFRNGQAGTTAALAQSVSAAIKKANTAIFKTATADANYQGMGTTLVMMALAGNRAVIAHVGDSRLYRLRKDRLELITRDHSVLQEQVTQRMISAEEAKLSHNRNLVTRALGVEATVELELQEEPVLPGDIYLLCSDGLNDMVDDADIELVLRSLKANLPLAAQQLVMIANDHGGHDNVSVILAKIKQPAAPKAGLLGRVLGWFK
jgi:protein phosphatase